MSETKERYHFKPNVPAIISMTIEDRDKLVADARREALEEACKAECVWCKEGKEVKLDKRLGIVHIRKDGSPLTHCNAKAIRLLIGVGK